MDFETTRPAPARPSPRTPVEKAENPNWRLQVPSVSQFTRRLRGHIEDVFFDVWIRGEISNLRKPSSGHAYFILKDATAQLKGCVFRPVLSKLKFQMEDGQEVLVHGKISVYEPRGEYQVVADWIEPMGLGALQLAFEQLKKRLEAEGLFAESRKRALPPMPCRIGIVTSPTGAAIRDILQVTSRRYHERHHYLIPAAVQGERAAGEIVAAIELAEAWNLANPAKAIEVLIVGRGGGSLEDLWPFNEEIVARAIFKCPIPIISAVGHEIDFTIADFVADRRAPTPSAAAEIVFPRKEDVILRVENLTQRNHRAFRMRLQRERERVTALRRRMVDPSARLKWTRSRLEALTLRLQNAMTHSIRLQRAKVERRTSQLSALSPLQVLGRGYSVAYAEDGTLVKSAQSLPVGATLLTRFHDGEVWSEVVRAGTHTPTEKGPSP